MVENTRKNYRKNKTNEAKTRNKRRRALPIWLRLIIVVLLCLLALVVGLMIGYGVIGGGNPLEVFDWSLWQQIIDIMTGAE
ncbi:MULTISPECIES: DNA-directed RNA polymerase subunit beta [Salimicrobium]|uniref:DNA-directed RNA polymerase subunit beta n=4 Tax=Salimicrobium TaxID=351195 RepID=K2GLV7_9BACI|nr:MULTISPECIES: DNA-directed RNA polymerase subunit beta [Salimicrobium]AKG03739.1 hypothetical protein AAV35_002335 [Salimicrobium jeotgali]EKE31404.1 hypothetical protein MJ3_08521 [Salimicrobium jeotgali]MBM7697014.1 ABC-type Fe3+ transport system permease subunit [Salimicrobium jeotgali]PBB06422.1 DNA-directed RNA polymerase subunit beta [Salimicrobium humidisoli]SDX80202.1 DNA-directed RNA polymerase subunit beta [Salimicrobium album]